mmetsp:Transcript_58191/g.93994  ORF Transcript_58191/g.93994 Transcript_58191/m.93994 type:complete len:206 (-) Transcript_58191:666-1283(-)
MRINFFFCCPLGSSQHRGPEGGPNGRQRWGSLHGARCATRVWDPVADMVKCAFGCPEFAILYHELAALGVQQRIWGGCCGTCSNSPNTNVEESARPVAQCRQHGGGGGRGAVCGRPGMCPTASAAVPPCTHSGQQSPIHEELQGISPRSSFLLLHMCIVMRPLHQEFMGRATQGPPAVGRSQSVVAHSSCCSLVLLSPRTGQEDP